MGSQLKVLLLLLSAVFLAATLIGAWWFYTREFRPGWDNRQVLRDLAVNPPAAPDPGQSRYHEAMRLIEQGERLMARDQLLDLVRHYGDSARYRDAKRVIGEINADLLLSDLPGSQKKDYIVRRGDSLLAIANRHDTTVDFIMRANNLVNASIHPGDRLIVVPLDFKAVVSLGEETLTLLKEDRFFKEYPLESIRLPDGVRVPFATEVREKTAWLGDRRVSFNQAGYQAADKWLQFGRHGLVLRSGSEAERQEAMAVSAEIQLDRADIEELFVLLSVSTPLTVVD
jgi:LysM repeat protein